MLRTKFVPALFSVAGCSLALLAVATAASPIALYDGGDSHEGIGQGDSKALVLGTTYQAQGFPLALRLRPPDAHWGGIQFESGVFKFVQLQHFRTGNMPLHGTGQITIEASSSSTPSPANAIQRLHATPHIQAGPITATRVAGFAGQSFNATIVGTDNPPICKKITCAAGVSFAPFTTNRHCGFCSNTMHAETRDVKFGGEGQLFQITVIDVRGTTVVFYLESDFADQPRFPPTKTFPTFLPYAKQMLSTLGFPR